MTARERVARNQVCESAKSTADKKYQASRRARLERCALSLKKPIFESFLESLRRTLAFSHLSLEKGSQRKHFPSMREEQAPPLRKTTKTICDQGSWGKPIALAHPAEAIGIDCTSFIPSSESSASVAALSASPRSSTSRRRGYFSK